MHPYEVLRRPVVTEKSTLLQGEHKYVFEVADAANKAQIREAVEKAFEVKVLNVNVARVKGRMRRFGRNITLTQTWKKAIVTLRPGDSIEYFEGV